MDAGTRGGRMDAGTRRGAAPTTIRPTPPSFTAPTFVRALNQGGHLRFAKTHLRSILPTFVSTHDYSRLQCRELSTQSLPRLSRLYFHCRRVFARSCSDPTFPIGSITCDRLRRSRTGPCQSQSLRDAAFLPKKPVGMNIPVDPLSQRLDDGVGRGNVHTYAIDFYLPTCSADAARTAAPPR